VAADCLRTHFSAQMSPTLGVAFGVYDLASRIIGVPSADRPTTTWAPGLLTPPSGTEFVDFITDVVNSDYITGLLNSEPIQGH
jgi:uncharacterized membrane-anchored protein